MTNTLSLLEAKGRKRMQQLYRIEKVAQKVDSIKQKLPCVCHQTTRCLFLYKSERMSAVWLSEQNKRNKKKAKCLRSRTKRFRVCVVLFRAGEEKKNCLMLRAAHFCLREGEMCVCVNLRVSHRLAEFIKRTLVKSLSIHTHTHKLDLNALSGSYFAFNNERLTWSLAGWVWASELPGWLTQWLLLLLLGQLSFEWKANCELANTFNNG